MEEKTKSLTQEEKDVLEKLRQVESSVGRNIKKKNRELIATKYYGELTMDSKQGPLIFSNVFMPVSPSTKIFWA